MLLTSKNAPRLDESDIFIKEAHGASTGAIFWRPWAALGGLSYTFRFYLLGPPLRAGSIVELHGENFDAAFEGSRSGGVPFLLLRTRSRHSQYYGSFFLTSLDYYYYYYYYYSQCYYYLLSTYNSSSLRLR